MENGPLHDDKLFRAVNERLSNYEAPYEGADWDAMRRSLDQLPKSSRFQWKFSLNSVLIGLGVVGISVLGFAISRNGGKNAPERSAVTAPQHQEASKPQPNTPVQNVSMSFTNTPQPDPQNGFQPAGTGMMPGGNNSTAGMSSDNRSLRRKKNDNAGGFLFGDMIDRRKGFIYNTQENPSLVNSHTDSIPSTYFDVVDGHVIKKIRLKDSMIHKNGNGADSAFSSSPQGAPTGEDTHGFDVN